MGTLFTGMSGFVPDYYKQKTKAEELAGRELSTEEFEREYLKVPENVMGGNGTSVFSPALCEMNYCWFTAKGDSVLDPFAGGSVRGIVAASMGRNYTGIDVRQEQVDANVAQAALAIPNSRKPLWIRGDSRDMDSIVGDESYDFVFTCPPYGDLEVYSDDPNDISTMAPEEFERVYTEILQRAAGHLKNDRFASVVVGNYRDRRGRLIDLCGITVRALEGAGLAYYNDVVYMTPAGSLPVRVGKQFAKSRKIGRRHQYMLNFVKGSATAATARLDKPERAQFQKGLETRSFSFPRGDETLAWLDMQDQQDALVLAALEHFKASKR